MKKSGKKRAWEIIPYPESVPPEWVKVLQKTGLTCAISPLHDRDVNPGGEPKKPHWHVLAVWAGPTTENVVKSLAQSLGTDVYRAVESVKGLYLYLTHKHNPEKAQYAEEDIQHLNGFNLLDYCDLSANEITEAKRKLQRIIRDMGMIEYSDLLEFLEDSNMPLEWEVATKHPMFFSSYLRSRRHRAAHGTGVIPLTDPTTGEVLADDDE